MENRETLVTVAKRYGVKWREVYKIAQELKINVVRMDATLNPKQADKLHTYFQNAAKANVGRTTRQSLKSGTVPGRSTVPVIQKRRPERSWRKQCECCDLPWVYLADEDTYKPHCGHCEGHHPKTGEDDVRRLRRSSDHATRYRSIMDRAWASVAKAEKEKQIAYDKRHKWRAALAEVMLDHEPVGRCWCTEQGRCRTWRKLEEANTGIHRNVETLFSYSDSRLDATLYGEDWTRMEEREEAEIDRRARALADAKVAQMEELAYPDRQVKNPSDRASSA